MKEAESVFRPTLRGSRGFSLSIIFGITLLVILIIEPKSITNVVGLLFLILLLFAAFVYPLKRTVIRIHRGEVIVQDFIGTPITIDRPFVKAIQVYSFWRYFTDKDGTVLARTRPVWTRGQLEAMATCLGVPLIYRKQMFSFHSKP